MSPDLFFWYGLVLKAAMTATIVVIVSVAAEGSGPFAAALLAALPTAAGGECCAGRRRGHDGEPLDRLVCIRRVRSVSHRAGNFCGDHASARGREGGGCRARPCAARTRGPASRISRSALSRRVDRRVVVARGWPCDLDVVERRALARATSAAAHRLTGRAALLLDGELLLVDHLGPFAGLGLDVIGELFR